jgi:hypothetical protein
MKGLPDHPDEFVARDNRPTTYVLLADTLTRLQPQITA